MGNGPEQEAGRCAPGINNARTHVTGQCLSLAHWLVRPRLPGPVASGTPRQVCFFTASRVAGGTRRVMAMFDELASDVCVRVRWQFVIRRGHT